MKKKDSKSQKFLKIFPSKNIYKNLAYISFFVLILFFFIINKVGFETYDFKLGDISPIEIRANKDVVDRVSTEALKKDIRKNTEAVYRLNPSVQTTMKSIIGDFFYNVKKYRKDEDLSLDLKLEKLSKESRVVIAKEDYIKALSMEEKEIDDFRMVIDDIIGQLMGPGIESEDIESEKLRVERIFKDFDYDDDKKKLGADLINSIIQPNKFYDKEETEKKIDNKLSELEAVMVKENQVIVGKNQKITSQALSIMEDLGMLTKEENSVFKISLGILSLIILLGTSLYAYVNLFHREILESNKLLLIFLIILGTIFISDLAYNLSAYLMPIAISGLLISLLIDIRLGIYVNVMVTFILFFVLKLDSSLVFMYLISGSLGSFIMEKNEKRNDLMLTGLLISLINILTIVAFGMIKSLEVKEIINRSLYGLGNGLICGILTIGTLPIWENIFKIITPLKLIELSNPNEELMKRLLLEAPGTYHHSITVGNLSERAASEIGADPLIARVAGYYHDIGKLARPYFFKENQIGINNPHDKLSASMSAKIIINHVRDGERLAKEKKLPKEIIDIICQHHGTTKVAYFYYEAKKSLEEGQELKLEDFTYPGEKPRTKEAAIVMLADSTEAAVRSLHNPTKEAIEDMIAKVIEGKRKEEQLNQCDITFRDLDKIEKVFVSTFMGVFHERIEYPDMDDLK